MLLLLPFLACRQPPCASQSGYLDLDGDGYGDQAFDGCDVPETFVALDGDCDDQDSRIHPDAVELCDGVDLNCDGQAEILNWWVDVDQDGFGAGLAISDCTQPAGYSATPGDCDDADPSAWPGAPETWYDDIDQDCDGGDDWDQDGDGSPYPSDCDDTDPSRAPTLYEICETGVDEDCNGLVDEDCQFFGGVAPGGAYMQVNGLAPSEWGEHQHTGDTVIALPDMDDDGLGDVGVCSSTNYNGGFHVFGSASAGGEVDLHSAVLSLEETCTNSKQVPRYLSQGFPEGFGVLLFGATLYSVDSLAGGPLVEGYGSKSVLNVVDLLNDGTRGLLYKTGEVSRSVYGIPGPLTDLDSDQDWRQGALWSYYSDGQVRIETADVMNTGVAQAVILESTETRVELYVADPEGLGQGLSVADPGLFTDLGEYLYSADQLLLYEDDLGAPLRLAVGGVGLEGRDTVLVLDVHYAEGVGGEISVAAGLSFDSPRFGTRPSGDLAFGDFNGDGFVDLAWGESGQDNAGVVYLVLGPLQGTYTSADAHGWLTRGQASYDTCEEANTPSCQHFGAYFGASLATLDHNGDGIDDLLIGAPFYETESPKHGPGAVFLFLGAEGSPW
ncbi:MAG: hypothetical protein ACI9VR_003232 [Cognaticolwellia sp.]|jgi:hypothetical protein